MYMYMPQSFFRILCPVPCTCICMYMHVWVYMYKYPYVHVHVHVWVCVHCEYGALSTLVQHTLSPIFPLPDCMHVYVHVYERYMHITCTMYLYLILSECFTPHVFCIHASIDNKRREECRTRYMVCIISFWRVTWLPAVHTWLREGAEDSTFLRTVNNRRFSWVLCSILHECLVSILICHFQSLLCSR